MIKKLHLENHLLSYFVSLWAHKALFKPESPLCLLQLLLWVFHKYFCCGKHETMHKKEFYFFNSYYKFPIVL